VNVAEGENELAGALKNASHVALPPFDLNQPMDRDLESEVAKFTTPGRDVKWAVDIQQF
jgi:hypothetical protein